MVEKYEKLTITYLTPDSRLGSIGISGLLISTFQHLTSILAQTIDYSEGFSDSTEGELWKMR